MKKLKILLCLLSLPLFLISCEPEEIDLENGIKNKNQPKEIITFSDTGDQETPPVEKKP